MQVGEIDVLLHNRFDRFLIHVCLHRFQELDLSAEALVLNDSSREADWRDRVHDGLKNIDKQYYPVSC